jgi:hypothetical protein
MQKVSRKGVLKMHKGGFVVCIVIVCVLSPAAFAAIGQAEGFLVGAGNGVTLLTDGAAENVNTMIVENSQDASSPNGNVKAIQSETGSLVQGTSAVGMGGVFEAVQGAGAIGEQWQFVPDFGSLGAQGQDLDAGLAQDVVKLGGVGNVLAVQAFIGCQVQFIVTPFGVSANVQYVGVALFDGIGGSPDSTTAVSAGANVGAGQF